MQPFCSASDLSVMAEQETAALPSLNICYWPKQQLSHEISGKKAVIGNITFQLMRLLRNVAIPTPVTKGHSEKTKMCANHLILES